MAMVNQPTPLPGASPEEVGRGRYARVLFSFNNAAKKKIFNVNSDVILISLFY